MGLRGTSCSHQMVNEAAKRQPGARVTSPEHLSSSRPLANHSAFPSMLLSHPGLQEAPLPQHPSWDLKALEAAPGAGGQAAAESSLREHSAGPMSGLQRRVASELGP